MQRWGGNGLNMNDFLESRLGVSLEQERGIQGGC